MSLSHDDTRRKLAEAEARAAEAQAALALLIEDNAKLKADVEELKAKAAEVVT